MKLVSVLSALCGLVFVGCSSAGMQTKPQSAAATPSPQPPQKDSIPPVKQEPKIEQPPPVIAANWRRLRGALDASDRWGSGWITLEQERSFKASTKMRFQIGGKASTVAIRMLGKGQNPNDKVGILGQFPVPPDKMITVELDNTYDNIVQISVHGGLAFGIFGDEKNGSATLQGAEILEPAGK